MVRFTGLVRRSVLWVALATLGVALAVGCGGGDDNGGDDNGGAAATAAATAATGGGGAGAGGEMEIKILFKDNIFEPDAITVPVGTTVTFEYENVGTAIHNMMIQSADSEGEIFQSPTVVNPGDKGEFVGTFTKAGQIQFICVYHQPDMSGTLTVE
ncbi:MAG: cupredoxin domain-containing protein [Dehalococcoidia bacterium]